MAKIRLSRSKSSAFKISSYAGPSVLHRRRKIFLNGKTATSLGTKANLKYKTWCFSRGSYSKREDKKTKQIWMKVKK